MKYFAYCGLAIITLAAAIGHVRNGNDFLAALCFIGTLAWIWNAAAEIREDGR